MVVPNFTYLYDVLIALGTPDSGCKNDYECNKSFKALIYFITEILTIDRKYDRGKMIIFAALIILTRTILSYIIEG